jgi:GntR family transcriptional repressor for pyruvate dehydrogenase complex
MFADGFQAAGFLVLDSANSPPYVTADMTGHTSTSSSIRPERGFVSRNDLAALLERQILSGEIKIGARLPSERQLAERFGVSRPVVREAIRGLAERKLVDVAPGRGTFVRSAQVSDAVDQLSSLYRHEHVTPRNLVEARMMLECTAAELAAERADAADLAVMTSAVDRLEASPTIIEQARYDLLLHLSIARASRNPVIEVLFSSIGVFTLELMLRSLSDAAVTTVSFPYHHKIVHAIEARDPVAARAAMAEHLDVATRLYGDDFDRSLEHVARQEVSRLLHNDATLDDLLRTAMTDRSQTREHRDG